MPISVGIIGLGQIAEGYDEPAGPAVSTHIKACLSDPRFSLDWIADIDQTRAESVKTRWGLRAVIVSPAALVSKRPDVLCIASPDETHARWIEAALAAPPRVVLCEKPLASTAPDGQRLVEACAAANVTLAINFLRRWLPGVAEWISAARAGLYGAPVAASFTYYRGLRHNACHWFDLVGSALGAHCSDLDLGEDEVVDFGGHDPTISARMTVRYAGVDVPVQATGVDHAQSREFSLDLQFEQQRLRIWNEDGIHVETEQRRGERRILSSFVDKPARYMALVWSDLADHLTDGRPLRAAAAESLEGMMLLDQVASAVETRRRQGQSRLRSR